MVTPTHIGKAVPDQLAFEAMRTRLMSRCRMTDNGCWEYTGYVGPMGYGLTNWRGRNHPVHRLMHMIDKGSIAPGLDVLHSCDNTKCFNPDHLRAGTAKENTGDSVKRKRHYGTYKTQCKRGHPLSGKNVYREKSGRRHCKTCDRAKKRIQCGWPVDLAYSEPPMQGHYPKDLKRVAYVKKGRQPKKVCNHGHKIEGANLYVGPDGYRKCRRCRTKAVARFAVKLAKQSETEGDANAKT